MIGIRHRALGINGDPSGGGILLGAHPGQWHLRELGVGDEMINIGLGQLDALGNQVK